MKDDLPLWERIYHWFWERTAYRWMRWRVRRKVQRRFKR